MNGTDPTGLWTWKLNNTGRLFIVSEDGDTIYGLILQGYPNLIPQAKVVGLNTKLRAGQESIDITFLLPKAAATALRDQFDQVIDESLKTRFEAWHKRKYWLGERFGDAFTMDEINRMQDVTMGEGQCYGFVGLMLGASPPANIPPKHFSLNPTFGEKTEFPDVTGELPGTYIGTRYGLHNAKYSVARVVPKHGLKKVLIGGGRGIVECCG